MNIRNSPIVVALVVLLAAPAAAHANEEVYRKTAVSTVEVLDQNQNRVGGSGSLIDADRRLVVTADHVIAVMDGAGGAGKLHKVHVIFGQKDAKGNIITDLFYYSKHKAQLAISGKVVARDRIRDLALIQLDRLPPGVQPLPMAKDGPTPGQTVHVVGHSGLMHGGLFNYCNGPVRNVYNWEPGSELRIGRSVAHQAPTNKGDSGGPVVNDKGELVAVISVGTIGEPSKPGQWTFMQQVIDHSVHVSEVRYLMDNIPQATAEDAAVPGLLKTLEDDGQANKLKAVFSLANLGGSAKSALATMRRIANEADDGEFKTALRKAIKQIESSTSTATGAFQSPTLVSGDFKLTALPSKDAGLETFLLPFQSGDDVTITIKGTTGSDLDLIVFDDKGQALVRQVGVSDQETGKFRAAYTGMYAVKVLNMGNAPNPYTFSTKVANAGRGAVTVIRSLSAKGTDVYSLQFEAGKAARVSVRGDGETPLLLSIVDGAGKEIVRSAGGMGAQTVTFTPSATLSYTVRVTNQGTIWNRYQLSTP